MLPVLVGYGIYTQLLMVLIFRRKYTGCYKMPNYIFSIRIRSNPFATPIEILPEWYLYPTFNLLRILASKLIGILSLTYDISN